MFSSRKELKARAQQSMAFTKPSYLIIGIIMVIVVNAESWLGAILGAGTAFTYGTYEELMAGVEAYMDNLPLALTLASLVLTMFVSVIKFGFKSYCLRISRGEKEVGIDELVSGFQCFWKVMGLNILTGLFTALWLLLFIIPSIIAIYRYLMAPLWLLLFIIPGIIALYRYRMAPLLMMDQPDWSITKCIKESGRMMKGHKMDLFILDLSFIGWMLLSSICAMITYVPVMDIWLMPYMQVTECHFYNELEQQYTASKINNKGPAQDEWWEN